MAPQTKAMSLAWASKIASHKASPTAEAGHFVLSACIPAVVAVLVLLPLVWMPDSDTTGEWRRNDHPETVAPATAGWPYAVVALPTSLLVGTVSLGRCIDSIADFTISTPARVVAVIVATVTGSTPLWVATFHADRATFHMAGVSSWSLAWVAFFLCTVALLPRHDRGSGAVAAVGRFCVHVGLAVVWWMAFSFLFAVVLADSAVLQVAAYTLLVPAASIWLTSQCEVHASRVEADAGPTVASLVEHLGSVCTVLLTSTASNGVVITCMVLADGARQVHAVMTLTGAARRLRLATSRMVRLALLSAGAAAFDAAATVMKCRVASVLPMWRATRRHGRGTQVAVGDMRLRARMLAARGSQRRARMGTLVSDGETQITPERFNLICMLYDQKPPKMFGQYDAQTVKREHMRLALQQVLAQHSRCAALLQVLVIAVALAQVQPVTYQLYAPAVLLGSDAGLYFEALVWAVGAALVAQGCGAWVMWGFAQRRFGVNTFQLLHFEQRQRRGLISVLQCCALLAIVVAGICWRSGAMLAVYTHSP